MSIKPIDNSYKIVIVGNCGVGKSNILLRYSKDQFKQKVDPTIGVAFTTKVINLNDKKIKLDLWDTAGQERFKGISRAYYRGAKGIVLVYDTTKYESFYECKNWLSMIKEYCDEDIPIILVGNKNDLKPVVLKSEAKEFANNNSMLFCEASAFNSANIDMIFITLVKEIQNDIKQHNNIIEQNIEPKNEIYEKKYILEDSQSKYKINDIKKVNYCC